MDILKLKMSKCFLNPNITFGRCQLLLAKGHLKFLISGMTMVLKEKQSPSFFLSKALSTFNYPKGENQWCR